ncbi:MAG: hypothetical protein IJH95_06755 [Mogibacterium sp.]|nr:hypothetical protein [Mogibacterium sp.]
MISVSIKGVLIGVLLIALIVLVVYLIILVSNLTDTVKKANTILDMSTDAAISAKNKVDEVNNSVREKVDKVNSIVDNGLNTVKGAAGKVTGKVKELM